MKKMLSVLTGIAMLTGTAAAMPVQAEEQVKDFNYYWNLDDYSVYCEFVELYGEPGSDADVVPEETLPKMTDLPWYVYAKDCVTNDDWSYGVYLSLREDVTLSDEEWEKLVEDPSYFGFPDTWSVPGSSVLRPTGDGGSMDLTFEFYKLEYYCDVYGRQDVPVIRSVIDAYRLIMTVQHSQFAEDYVMDGRNKYREIYFSVPLGTEPYYLIGDPNEDGVVNAEDAADVLSSAAHAGAGNGTELSGAQGSAADVNGDGKFDASDASAILQYSAALGTGDRYVKIKDFT